MIYKDFKDELIDGGFDITIYQSRCVSPNGRGAVAFTYMMPFQQQGDANINLDVYVNGKKLAEPLVRKKNLPSLLSHLPSADSSISILASITIMNF